MATKFTFATKYLNEGVRERIANGETPVVAGLYVDYIITPRYSTSEACLTAHFEGEDEEFKVFLYGDLNDYIELHDCDINDLDIDWKEEKVTI